MKLSLPLAVALALLANLVPGFGKVLDRLPAGNDAPPQPSK
jgi:hypothetical protein